LARPKIYQKSNLVSGELWAIGYQGSKVTACSPDPSLRSG
jgi:hypothetical protein